MISEEYSLFMNYKSSEIVSKIYELFRNKKFSKLSEQVEKLILQLDSLVKNTIQIEEINFISEICVKACKKLIKQHKISHRLILLTAELANKYSSQTRVIYMHKINNAESLIIEGKISEAKEAIKATIKSIEDLSECTDLISKLYIVLSKIYLNQHGKLEKSLKYSQKAYDQCLKKINSSHENSFYKYIIEAIYLKGLYYSRTMDFPQAQQMLQRAKEISLNINLCKHLSDSLRKLAREISFIGSRKPIERTKTNNIRLSGSMEINADKITKSRTSYTVIFRERFGEHRQRKIHENLAAVKIQSFFKMCINRKKYSLIREKQVLSCIRRTIDGVDYIISAFANRKSDVIIEAIPLLSKVVTPASFYISKSDRKEYGIADGQNVGNLLCWVSVLSGRVFVSHKLNKKRLLLKIMHSLYSDAKFYVRVFENEENIIVQVTQEKNYELVLNKNAIPVQFTISPMALLAKVKFESNKLVYLNSSYF